MAVNIDETCEGKLTCAFKNDEEFSTFEPKHARNSKNWNFYVILLSKVENV